jgi:hypothetical protein
MAVTIRGVEFHDERLKAIHKLIHGKKEDGSNFDKIMINRTEYRIQRTGVLRKVVIAGEVFIEQNPATGSRYAARAKAGECLTWWMRAGKWVLISGDPDNPTVHY